MMALRDTNNKTLQQAGFLLQPRGCAIACVLQGLKI